MSVREQRKRGELEAVKQGEKKKKRKKKNEGGEKRGVGGSGSLSTTQGKISSLLRNFYT